LVAAAASSVVPSVEAPAASIVTSSAALPIRTGTDGERRSNQAFRFSLPVKVREVDHGGIGGAKHSVNLADVRSSFVNKDASEGRRSTGEGHHEPSFVADSFHGALEHDHTCMPPPT
jgi:hypothetical protein